MAHVARANRKKKERERKEAAPVPLTAEEQKERAEQRAALVALQQAKPAVKFKAPARLLMPQTFYQPRTSLRRTQGRGR